MDLRAYARDLVKHALRESAHRSKTRDFEKWSEQPLKGFFKDKRRLTVFIRDVLRGAQLLRVRLVDTGHGGTLHLARPITLTAEERRFLAGLTGKQLISIVGYYLQEGALPDISPQTPTIFERFYQTKIDRSPRPPGMSSPPDTATPPRPPATSTPDAESPASEPPAPLYEKLEESVGDAGVVPIASLVRVFYGTDRLESIGKKGPSYDHQRSASGAIHYGECKISVPKVHKLGKLETPSIIGLDYKPDPKKHIILQKIESLEEAVCLKRVAASVDDSDTKEAFIFVHGYYVSFENAARRTGQIAFDLHFVGAPIFYSWPSNGKLKDYVKDETNVAWSAPHFQRFLTLIAQHCGAKRIHIIAHSMGNRAVCEALKALSYVPDSGVKFNHLVLAAADIDADTFRELAATLQKVSGHITLYESSKDKALRASKKIHGNPRAGEPLLIIPGMDTIDATTVNTDFLGHSYFSETWTVLSDIHSILSKDTPPRERFGLDGVDNPDGKYYVFKASA